MEKKMEKEKNIMIMAYKNLKENNRERKGNG